MHPAGVLIRRQQQGRPPYCLWGIALPMMMASSRPWLVLPTGERTSAFRDLRVPSHAGQVLGGTSLESGMSTGKQPSGMGHLSAAHAPGTPPPRCPPFHRTPGLLRSGPAPASP